MSQPQLAGRAVPTTSSPRKETTPSSSSSKMVQKSMGRLRIRLNRARNLKGPEILGMSNCLVVFTFEGRREESSVRVNDIAPLWNEEFIFDQVAYPPTSKVAITIVYRSGKKDEVLGVAAPGHNLWSVGAQAPQDRWLPIATKEGIYAGELNFSIHWAKTEVRYRKPVQLLQAAVGKSQALTGPLEAPLEKALGGVAGLGASLKTKVSYLSRAQKALLFLALAAAAAGLCAAVLLPALLFFPVTLVLLTGAACGAVAASPLLLLLGWLLLASKPVQTRLVAPAVERALEVEALKKLLTLE